MLESPYKGYLICPRTFQHRKTARWTSDVVIARNGRLRSFTGTATYDTKAHAEAGCLDLGRHIIDAAVPKCNVADL